MGTDTPIVLRVLQIDVYIFIIKFHLCIKMRVLLFLVICINVSLGLVSRRIVMTSNNVQVVVVRSISSFVVLTFHVIKIIVENQKPGDVYHKQLGAVIASTKAILATTAVTLTGLSQISNAAEEVKKKKIKVKQTDLGINYILIKPGSGPYPNTGVRCKLPFIFNIAKTSKIILRSFCKYFIHL